MILNCCNTCSVEISREMLLFQVGMGYHRKRRRCAYLVIADENKVLEVSEALLEKNRETYEIFAQVEDDMRNHRIALI